MEKPKDHPLNECAQAAETLVAQGMAVYQKFTCSNCGSRQTMAERNVFYTSGECQECGSITDITKSGCNYLVHAVLNKRPK